MIPKPLPVIVVIPFYLFMVLLICFMTIMDAVFGDGHIGNDEHADDLKAPSFDELRWGANQWVHWEIMWSRFNAHNRS